MDSFLTIQDAAARWCCSERSVQMLCKQGRIPGAKKVSGIWLMPENSLHPREASSDTCSALHPALFYGRNTTVCLSSDPGDWQLHDHGCSVTQYDIIDGITLVFQDIHEETLDYGGGLPQLPSDLIAIQHCRIGRFEGEYANGECIYMGPGSLSVNLPAWAPVSNSFPLRHYHGFYLAIQPRIAAASMEKLEAVLGPMQIDFSVLSDSLSETNRLAFYTVDDAAAQLLSSVYPVQGHVRVEQLKLRVLALLQWLCTQELQSPGPDEYFPRDQVQTVKRIRSFLISHLDQHIALPKLAAMFHLSLTGMKHCFKGVYGQSIGAYLREYRIQAGAEQLVATDAKIIDIAASLGYKNASKFSEAFSFYYGIAPTDYRKTFCPAGGPADDQE